jgi:hypothetical protein
MSLFFFHRQASDVDETRSVVPTTERFAAFVNPLKPNGN